MTAFFAGIGYVWRSFAVLFAKGIWPFVVVPLLVNIVVFSGAILLAVNHFQDVMTLLTGWLPTWLAWVEWLLWPLFTLLVLVAVYFGFTVVANLIAAPFNSLLAERVESKLKGLPVTEFEGFKTIPGIALRTLMSELRKLIYALKWMIVLLVITVIPGLNLLAPFLWALYGAWMLSIQYSDYPMSNHGLYFKQERQILKQYRYGAYGFGGAMMVLTAIPVFNFIAVPVGVIAGTRFWVEQLSENQSGEVVDVSS